MRRKEASNERAGVLMHEVVIITTNVLGFTGIETIMK